MAILSPITGQMFALSLSPCLMERRGYKLGEIHSLSLSFCLISSLSIFFTFTPSAAVCDRPSAGSGLVMFATDDRSGTERAQW